jgi:hypothetical protein
MPRTFSASQFRFIQGLLLALVIWALALPVAHAQFRVEMSGVGASQVPIAIARFRDEDRYGQVLSAIVRADLERSGLFRGVDASEVLDEMATPAMAQWRARAADALVVGWIGTRQVFYEAVERTSINKQADIHDDLVAWLRAREREEGPLVVVMDDDASKRLGYRTRTVGYHWIEARTRLQDVLKLVDQRGARYLILRSDAQKWRVHKDDPATFAVRFELVPQRFDGMRVYRVRAPGEQP